MEKLEEAKQLAEKAEEQADLLAQEQKALDRLTSPWDIAIRGLGEQIENLVELRDSQDDIAKQALRRDAIKGRLYERLAELRDLAHDLIDAKAFFPSEKKSQVLTDRVTLKSQMPKLPEVVDPMALVEALVADKRLWEFVKGISVKLDNGVAEAIMRWWQNREDKDIGLEAPQPKILNIKVKPKEETE